ncbi:MULTISPECIES: SLATT domain-containing protein [unclassified Mesorhizobium]|uniref:SLATT domain-containing protein n=1 Tax=unclassified Mesorhizobium TaxID=325217 RepID=UPI001672891E|nr:MULTISPECIES: SLATT domain-containing protein [unclassified Mesorhizobium]
MGAKARGARARAVAVECRRQEESCLYTSTSLFIWLRFARLWNWFFILTPVVLASVAGIAVFKEDAWLAAGLAFLTGIVPALREALKLDIHVEQIKSLAAEFKALQDAFRRVALVYAPTDPDAAEKRLEALMDRLDAARSGSVTIPEWAFKRAQVKISAGHYDFSVDDA